MRLIRRTLLCLIVGVTAFGVSGWLLRPRPTWTAAFSRGNCGLFAIRVLEPFADGPIWIACLCTSLKGDWNDDCKLVAFHPETGAVSATIHMSRWMVEHASAVDNGAVVTVDRSNGSNGPQSSFEYFDGKSSHAAASLKLQGRWFLHAPSNSVWTLKPTDGRHRFVQIELPSGRTIHEFEVPGAGPHSAELDPVLCDEGKRLAVLLRGPTSVAPTVQFWDVAEGRMLRDVQCPPSRSGDSMQWSFKGRKLFLGLYSFEKRNSQWIDWVVDPDRGDFRLADSLAPTLPSDAEWLHRNISGEFSGRRTIWSATTGLEDAALFFISQNDDETVEWRRTPANSRLSYVLDRAESGSRFVVGVPTKREVVCCVSEPTAAANLPEGLRRFVPKEWSAPVSEVTRWHDWDRNEWRNVGCPSNLHIWQLRPNALITYRVPVEDALILQSWPLPPRDPKWPAAGIAVACSVGVWWMCAKRYARRMRKAA